MLTLKANDLQDIALDKLANNAKQDKNIPDMLNRLANAMSTDAEVYCKSDFNMGQIIEGFIRSLKTHKNERWGKCYEADLEDGNGSWEIKTSLNCYNLATPLVKPTRTIFITNSGAYSLTKKQLEEIFQEPYDFQDYIKMDKKGLRLKPQIAEIGKPVKWLNEVLGF